MGLAASQARYLTLTARLSSTEFQGQQINQQRTSLADESGNLFNEMLSLSVPTPPSSDDYSSTTTYSYTDDDGNKKTISGYSSNDDGTYTITYSDGSTATADSITTSSGILSSVTFSGDDEATSLSSTTKTADDKYEEAYIEYEYQKDLYDQEIANLTAKTSSIQQKDKTLEMQLRQLDSAEKAYQTELESVKKVIEKNIELTFKTFA